MQMVRRDGRTGFNSVQPPGGLHRENVGSRPALCKGV